MTPASVYPILALGLLAASQSGNLVRLGAASAAAIVGWRLVLAALVFLPVAGPRRMHAELAALGHRDRWLLLAAGLALSGHLLAWVASVQLTTVANAMVVFSVNPVFTAIAAHFIYGERLTGRLLVAIGLGVAGVAVMGWHDLSADTGHLAGHLAALAGALFFSLYFLLGKRLRRSLSSPVYVCSLYALAAVPAFAWLLWQGAPLIAYDGRTWLCFGLMALVPTVVGHSSLNHALRYLDASRVSAATLVEPLLAGAVAWVAWDEAVTPTTAAGFGLVALAVVLLLAERLWPGRSSAPAGGERRPEPGPGV